MLMHCYSKKISLKSSFMQALYATSEQGGFYGVSKRAAEDYVENFTKNIN